MAYSRSEGLPSVDVEVSSVLEVELCSPATSVEDIDLLKFSIVHTGKDV